MKSNYISIKSKGHWRVLICERSFQTPTKSTHTHSVQLISRVYFMLVSHENGCFEMNWGCDKNAVNKRTTSKTEYLYACLSTFSFHVHAQQMKWLAVISGCLFFRNGVRFGEINANYAFTCIADREYSLRARCLVLDDISIYWTNLTSCYMQPNFRHRFHLEIFRHRYLYVKSSQRTIAIRKIVKRTGECAPNFTTTE